jgi:hypothetical protein
VLVAVGDPDPHVFVPPGSGSINQRYGSVSGSYPFLIKVLSGLKYCLQNKILTPNLAKNYRKFLRLKILCLGVSYKKKNMKKIFFSSLKSLKKEVGSGFISQRCQTNQNVTDPQHWLVGFDRCKPLERFWILLMKADTSRFIPS